MRESKVKPKNKNAHICAKCDFTFKGAQYFIQWMEEGKVRDGWCCEKCMTKGELSAETAKS